MTSVRAKWADLPPDVRHEIERVAGSTAISTEPQTGGYSAGLAERLLLADGRRVFLKAIRADGSATYDLYRREATVLDGLPRSIPAAHLIETVTCDDWFAMLIEDVDGRHPTRRVAHEDTTRILDAMHALSRVRGGSSLPLLSDELTSDARSWHRIEADDRIGTTTTWCAEVLPRLQAAAAHVGAAVAGDRLVHGDLRADNALIDATGRAVLLDWPWAARGAGWFDALLYLLDLRLADADTGVDVLLQHPVFDDAEGADIDAVLAAISGGWFEKCRQPAPPGMTTLRDFQRQEALTSVAWLRQRWS